MNFIHGERESDGFTIKADNLIGFDPSIQHTYTTFFGNFNGEPMVKFKSDGEITVAEGVKADEAAKAVIRALEEIWGSLPNRLKNAEEERDYWRDVVVRDILGRGRPTRSESDGIEEL